MLLTVISSCKKDENVTEPINEIEIMYFIYNKFELI